MNYKLRINNRLFHCQLTIVNFTLILLLITASSFAQKKDDTEGKSKKTEVIAGVKYYIHTVERGQTLFAIAKIYGRTVNDIVIENPESIDGIKPGQELKIPFDKVKPKE